MIPLFFLCIILCLSSTAATAHLYDITKSFEENYKQTSSLDCSISQRYVPPRSQWGSLLGYPIISPIGIPACAIMTSRGIALAAGLGFDVLTYKTICSGKVRSHPLPNICYVSCNRQIGNHDIGAPFYATDTPPEDASMIAISNSLGNPSDSPEGIMHDIAQARATLHEGQVLIVSVFGRGADEHTIAHDFAAAAQLAYEAGAQIIELNLSCPNVVHGFFYKNAAMVHTIIQCVQRVVPLPIIIKVGVFDSKEQMREILKSSAQAGARAICGINSVPVKIVTAQGVPFFGTGRITSGLSGAPIRTLAKQFIVDAREIIMQDNLDLIILATGGITSTEHFKEFFDLGADIVLSGTGAMHDPYLASRYLSEQADASGS